MKRSNTKNDSATGRLLKARKTQKKACTCKAAGDAKTAKCSSKKTTKRSAKKA